MKKKIEVCALFLIILANFLVRVAGLEKSPATMNFDEAALGYNAYSLLKTGKDEYGVSWPLSLRSFNDYKPALYSYLSIPFIKLWGLNQTSTRMVSAIAGTVSLVFLYLILKEFIKGPWLRLFILLILSLQPWRLHYSRVAFESNLSAMFFAGAMWSVLKSRDKFSWWRSAGIFILGGLSIYSYHSARVALPGVLFLWFLDPIKIIFKKDWVKTGLRQMRNNWKRLVIMGVILVVAIPIFRGQSSLVLTRLRQTNLFARFYPYTPSELIESGNFWFNWKNEPIYYLGGMVLGRVLAYLSPIDLSTRVFHWIKGSPQAIAGLNMYGWLEVLFLVAGFFWLLGHLKEDGKYRLLIYWTLCGIAPAAVTWNWFHPLRSLNIYPALDVLIALGIALTWKKAGVLKWIAAGLLGVSLIFYINNELVYGVWENNGEFQPGGFKQGAPILMSMAPNFDKVVIDSPHAQSYILFLFYSSYPPEIIQQYAASRPAPGVEGNLNFSFQNFEFRRFSWPEDKSLNNTLFWVSSEVKEDEINAVAGTDIIWVNNPLDYRAAAIISKK